MFEKISTQVPLIGVIKSYQRSHIRYDVIAGITVAAVAIPQAMAYAQLAGAPLVMGLYATLAGMLFFALFTTTKHVITGPDAAIAALTGATLLPFANGNALYYVALVALLAILIGIASLVAVVAKLSFLSEFLSRPILLGYMAGLALVVIASQMPKLFGLSGLSIANFFGSAFYVISNVSNVHGTTVVFSIILAAICYLFITKLPKVPVSLVVLLGSIVLSWLLNFKELGIATVGAIPSGLPIPALPRISYFDIQQLFIPAFAIMMVSYANTITTARSFAAKYNDHIDSSKELMALGITSIGCGLFGGMPIAASGVRTAVNQQSHSSGQISQIIAALVVALSLLFFTPILGYLPLPALAMIIIIAVLKLFDVKEFTSIWHAWRSEALLAISTMIGVTFLGIFQGLILAIFLAIVNLVRTSAFPTDAVLGRAKDGSIRDSKRPPKTEPIEGIIMYRFDAPLYFGNASYFRNRILQLLDEQPEVRWFLWDAETITSLDSTAGAMLLGLIREVKAKGVVFCVSRLKGPIRTTINKTNRLSNLMNSIPHYPSMGKALAAFEEEIANDQPNT